MLIRGEGYHTVIYQITLYFFKFSQELKHMEMFVWKGGDFLSLY